ncbi:MULTISPECIES: DUF1289 domain-containing protein [Paraburkholderia]|uniref:DUF1289 domain-containing protein n=1 Tax=Paraburkholderia TaxID=1822464 RepID=UPI0038BAD386
MAVSSPCVDVCRIDGKSGFGVGCFRKREEIRGWKNMTDHRRRRSSTTGFAGTPLIHLGRFFCDTNCHISTGQVT